MTNLTPNRYDAFLSHCKYDEAWTLKLRDRLEQEEWEGRKLKTFFSPRDIHAGESFTLRIEEALVASCTVVIVMSPEAMQSKWVQEERVITHYMERLDRRNRMIPLLLRDCDVPPLLAVLNHINFTDPARFEEKYQILLARIKAALPRCGSLQPTDDPVFPSRFIPRPPATGFVPRYNRKQRDVLGLVKEKLAPGQNQLVALWGPGGMGKTTLAIMVAREMYEDFSGRVVWINARADLNFGLSTMLDIIAARLDRPDLRAFSLEQKRKEVSELVDRTAPLIILDNFETIKPEEQKECEAWLTDEVSCSALITTRERVDSALSIPIGRMSDDAARRFLELLIRKEGDNE